MKEAVEFLQALKRSATELHSSIPSKALDIVHSTLNRQPRYRLWFDREGSPYLTLKMSKCLRICFGKMQKKNDNQDPLLESQEYPIHHINPKDHSTETFTTTIEGKAFVVKLTSKDEYSNHKRANRAWKKCRSSGSKSSLTRVYVPEVKAVIGKGSSEGFVMERVRPLPSSYCLQLAKIHMHKSTLPHVKNELPSIGVYIQLYLRDEAPVGHNKDATLFNRPVYLDEMSRESWMDTLKWASCMGQALAILHWEAGLDARGVKFQLGINKKGHLMPWMSDFGECRKIKVTLADVDEFLLPAAISSPYWPRPPPNHASNSDTIKLGTWICFKETYLEASAKLKSVDAKVQVSCSKEFIAGIEKYWKWLDRTNRQ